MTRAQRGWAAACCLLLLCGCENPPPPVDAFSDAWPVFAERADTSIADGRWDEAEHAVQAARACVRADFAPAWQLRERDRLERDLAAWRAGPDGRRDSIAAMARALRAARLARDSDSLVAAERWARLACELGARTLGPAHPRTARAELELGQVAFLLARVPEVDSLAAAAEAALAAAYGEKHPAVADAQELLGRALKNFTGRPARPRALERYREALRTRVALYGPLAPEVAESYHDVGNLERLCARPRAALEAFGVALAIRREALGPAHPDVASTLSAMGMLRASLGDWAGAESLLTAAVATAPDSATLSPVTRAFRLGLIGQMRIHQGRARDAEAPLREAIALSESAWALTPRDEGSTVFSGLGLYTDLAVALAAQGRAEEAFEVLERGTSRTLVERAPGTQGAVLPRLQHVLAPDAAMVSWVRDRFGSAREETAWACVVRSSGPPQWLRLAASTSRLPGGAMLNASFWRELRSTARWPMRIDAGSAERKLATQMGEAWFAPLEGALAGVRHVIVFSPDLVGGGPLGALADATGRSLLERYAISYAPSATFYVMERERRQEWAASAASLVVGDPAYRTGVAQAWPPLRGSREEIATVRASLPNVRVLAGAEASARELRALARTGELGRFRVLHLATHTSVDPTRMLESSLVLAPDRPGEGESMLSAREIADTWRLDADLVCLTGCQTALGMRAASQGLLGLQQALLRAGARSVLVSLWPVDDAVAALLVSEFYRRLAHASGPGARAEALRGAQRAVRDWENPAGARPYAHPAYWAGFTLVGDAG